MGTAAEVDRRLTKQRVRKVKMEEQEESIERKDSGSKVDQVSSRRGTAVKVPP